MKLLHFKQATCYPCHIMSAIGHQQQGKMEKDMAPPVSGHSSSQSEAPPARFNDHYCYGLLTKADRQVTANRTKSEKNARNISRLAKTMANLDNRMRAQERRGIRG